MTNFHIISYNYYTIATELGKFLSEQLRKLPADHPDRVYLEGIVKANEGYINKKRIAQEEGIQTLESATDVTQQGLEAGGARRGKRALPQFGILLDRYLYDRGIKQMRFAEQIGIARTSLTRIIWGHKGPSTDLILVISDKLELSEDERQALLNAVPKRRRRRRKGSLR